MKNQLIKFLGRNFYSAYSFGRSNYDYVNKDISFENQFFIHLLKEQIYFCINIEPIFIFDFNYFNLSKISIESHIEDLSIYSNEPKSISRFILPNLKKIKKIIVYGFPITEINSNFFNKNQLTTENFILFEFEDNSKLFFDSSCEISSVTLIIDESEINEKIQNYELIEAYSLVNN